LSDEARDRRQHARVPYGAWVTVRHGSDKSFYLSQNLSLGGVFLRSDVLLPIGTDVELLLVIEGQRDPIALIGNVVRLAESEGGFAVRFSEIGDEAAAQLLDLVQNQAHQSPEADAPSG